MYKVTVYHFLEVIKLFVELLDKSYKVLEPVSFKFNVDTIDWKSLFDLISVVLHL